MRPPLSCTRVSTGRVRGGGLLIRSLTSCSQNITVLCERVSERVARALLSVAEAQKETCSSRASFGGHSELTTCAKISVDVPPPVVGMSHESNHSPVFIDVVLLSQGVFARVPVWRTQGGGRGVGK